MAELENLSNDELRVELLKFGFANMPVTQTTRKVLMKKLKVAMEMQKSKTRRETVAVMKASDDDEPLEIARSKKEKTPRRATLAVVEKTKKVPATTTTTHNGGITPPKSKSPSRRSSRATPAKDKPIVSSTAAYLQDVSDDDVIEIIEPPIVSARRSKSKTPTSLARSETVRVSHFGSNVRNIPIVREEEISTEEEDKSYEIEFQEPAPVLVNRRTTTSALNYKNIPARNITPSKYGLTSSFTTSSYTPVKTYVSLSDEQDDDEDDGEEIDTPYLSSFAKRLSTLRAEPLDSGMGKYKKETENYNYNRVVPSTSTSTVNNYRYSSSQYTKPPIVRKEGVLNDMAREFDKMDQKFNVRKFIYICLIIMVIVAIYVILFT